MVGLLTVVVILLVAGSFCDDVLSAYLYQPSNRFAVLLAAFGQLPASAAFSVSGVLLYASRNKHNSRQSLLSVILALVLNSIALTMTIYESSVYYPNHSVILLSVITVLLLALINVFVQYTVKNLTSDQFREVAWFILFVVVAQVAVVNGLKLIWARPRFRLLMAQDTLPFQPWWIIGNTMKAPLLALGIGADEFKSFPSGHTASAACALLIGTLPYLNSKWLRYQKVLFGVSVIYIIMVAISRIIMGAHFLSDVTVGLLVTLVVLYVGERLFFKKSWHTD